MISESDRMLVVKFLIYFKFLTVTPTFVLLRFVIKTPTNDKHDLDDAYHESFTLIFKYYIIEKCKVACAGRATFSAK